MIFVFYFSLTLSLLLLILLIYFRNIDEILVIRIEVSTS